MTTEELQSLARSQSFHFGEFGPNSIPFPNGYYGTEYNYPYRMIRTSNRDHIENFFANNGAVRTCGIATTLRGLTRRNLNHYLSVFHLRVEKISSGRRYRLYHHRNPIATTSNLAFILYCLNRVESYHEWWLVETGRRESARQQWQRRPFRFRGIRHRNSSIHDEFFMRSPT